MTLPEIKQLLYEVVARYHPGAMVVWEKTKGVTPAPPYITLGYRNLNRSAFPLSDDEREHKYYNYDIVFEINLYTVGKEVKAGSARYFENTAVEDLEEFVRFLDSERITEELAQKSVTIICNPPIRDLSELIGDTKFNYRSMCEFTISYVGIADGQYGVSGNKLVPNASGGGTKEMVDAVTETIEEVEIKEGGYDNDEQSIG